MTEQAMRGLMFKACFVIIVLLLVTFSFIPSLPRSEVIIQISTVLGFAYFIVSTAGSIIEKTERLSVELFLSKPFTRRDIIFADFLGTVTAVSFLVLLFSIGSWLIFGFRQNEWDATLLALSLSMIIGFSSLYSFVILTGILVRNAALVILFWVGYVYFGALLLEARSDFIYNKLSGVFYRVIFDTLYYGLPQVLSICKVFSRLKFGAFSDFSPIMFSLISGAAALTASVLIFNRRDLD